MPAVDRIEILSVCLICQDVFLCQISTAARVCNKFAKDVAFIHSNCYLIKSTHLGILTGEMY